MANVSNKVVVNGRVYDFPGAEPLEEILEKMGATDITDIADGTVTGAIAEHDNKIERINTDLSDNGKTFKFGFDGTNYGYYKDGADTVTPFKQGLTTIQSVTGNGSATRTFDCTSINGYETLTVNDFAIDIKRIRVYTVQGSQSATTDYYSSSITKSYTNGVLTIGNLTRTISTANLYMVMYIESFDVKVCI